MPRITSEEKLKAVAAENARYLTHLRQTGNASMAARFAGRARETFTGRRRSDPDFDAACAAALVFSAASLARKGGAVPVGGGAMASMVAGSSGAVGGGGRQGADAPPRPGMVAQGGEYMVGANLNNGLQVRRARPGHVTARGEDAFLEALAATANIRLAAEAVGVDPRAFYKRRARSAEFARRMGEALAAGYEAVEFALVRSALRTLAPDGAESGGGEGGPIEPGARMSVDQAMALMAQRTKTMAIGDRHTRGVFVQTATREDTNAAILRKLRAIEARRTIAVQPGRGEDDD